MVPHVARRRAIGRAQFQTRHAGRHIEAGLRLGTNGLQRKGVVGAADHRIGTPPDTDRGIALHATVIAGEIARMDDSGRREYHPAQGYTLRYAEVDPETMDHADIAMRWAADRWHEHALEVKHRTDHKTGGTSAAAGKAAGFDVGLGAGWCGRHQHCGCDRRKTCRT